MAFPITTPQERRDRVDRLVEMLRKHPGLRLWNLSKQLGISHGATETLLTTAEDMGVLIYEDLRGKLYLLAEDA